MSDTETLTDTLVTECPKCEAPMSRLDLFRTYQCPTHGPWYHDPSDPATGSNGLGWLHVGMVGL